MKEKLVDIIKDEMVARGCEKDFILDVITLLYFKIENNIDLLTDLNKYHYTIHYCVNNSTDQYHQYYNKGKITISLYDQNKNSFVNYMYEIKLTITMHYDGYCTCNSNDKNYIKEIKCCGIQCDWENIQLNINKIYCGKNYTWDETQAEFLKRKKYIENMLFEK